MNPSVYEEVFNMKQFADFIGATYHSARRILIRLGGYQNVGNQNPNYETRSITKSRAEEIKRLITVPKKEKK